MIQNVSSSTLSNNVNLTNLLLNVKIAVDLSRGDYMDINKYKEQSKIEMIQSFMKQNKGYITTKIIKELGIHRMYLNIMMKNDIIEKVGKGVYITKETYEDEFFVFHLEHPNIIFSHMTALYLHNLSIKAPSNVYDITIYNKYHNIKLKNHNIFYTSKDIYNIGITETETPIGNMVKAYDIERCICDIIRSRKRMDIEHVKYSVKEYLKRKDKDLIKLSNYATLMGIKKEVLDFVSIMHE